MSIGQVIRARREALGLEQSDVAELVGTTVRQVSRWENGPTEPAASNCKRLARALSLTLDELHEVVPIGLDLSGGWFAAWDTTRKSSAVIDRHAITARHVGSTFSFSADGDYLWGGNLRVVDSVLMGTYLASEAGAVQQGTLYLRIGRDASSAIGRWSGRSVDREIGTGWGVLARDETRALELMEATIANAGPPAWWLGEDS